MATQRQDWHFPPEKIVALCSLEAWSTSSCSLAHSGFFSLMPLVSVDELTFCFMFYVLFYILPYGFLSLTSWLWGNAFPRVEIYRNTPFSLYLFEVQGEIQLVSNGKQE